MNNNRPNGVTVPEDGFRIMKKEEFETQENLKEIAAELHGIRRELETLNNILQLMQVKVKVES